MTRREIINIMYNKKAAVINGFDYDSLLHPPLSYMLSEQDISDLHSVALDRRLTTKPKLKVKYMDLIMRRRGFTRLGSGTNRVVYKHEYDPTIVIKVGLDSVGMSDNLAELYTQELIKPFCAKVFSVSPNGTVSLSERVTSFNNRAFFDENRGPIFDFLAAYMATRGLVGEDIGDVFFMNWGLREGFGPVLLDFPYIYPVDHSKLYCRKVDKRTGIVCMGEIDFDDGFNSLVCTKCGARHSAKSLSRISSPMDMGSKLVKGESTIMKQPMVCVKKLVDGKYVSHQVADAIEGETHIKSDAHMWSVKVIKASDFAEPVADNATIEPPKEEIKVEKPDDSKVINIDNHRKDTDLSKAIEAITCPIITPKATLIRDDALMFYKDAVRPNVIRKWENRPGWNKSNVHLDDALEMITFGAKKVAEKFKIDEESAKAILIEDLKQNYKAYNVCRCGSIDKNEEDIDMDEKKETSPQLVAKQSRINQF